MIYLSWTSQATRSSGTDIIKIILCSVAKTLKNAVFFSRYAFVKANKFERLYQSEGLPYNLSIEEFLD